jgi:hypothetical protein
VTYICPQCSLSFCASQSRANRAFRAGSPMFCGRDCAGIARRKNKTKDQKITEKAIYDAVRRERLADRIKAEKAARHLRTYDKAKAATERKMRAKQHAEYCRRPEYKVWKAEYDKEYRAKQEFGEFWESAILALEIRRECLALSDDIEIRRQAGTLNKHQNRRRNYDRSYSNKSEIGALGNP